MAPVKASISTPVRACVRTVQTTFTPRGLIANSTPTASSGKTWQSGISPAVCFAAWIPATRATASTSPFDSACLFNSRIVPAAQTSTASAVATRATTGLLPTSTIRASPFASTCDNFFCPLRPPSSLRFTFIAPE